MTATTDHTFPLWQAHLQRRDQRARAALIQRYRRLVPLTRVRLVPNVPVRLAAEDLDAEGTLALVRAIDRYDGRPGVKPESFIISYIRGAIYELLRREDWVPRSVRSRQKRVQAAEEALDARHGPGRATDAQRAAECGLSLDAWYQLYAEATVLETLPLEAVTAGQSEDDDALHLADQVVSPERGPDEQATERLEWDALAAQVRWLPGPQREVLELYYWEGLTMSQIAARLGKSDTRVYQIHLDGIRYLRERLGC